MRDGRRFHEASEDRKEDLHPWHDEYRPPSASVHGSASWSPPIAHLPRCSRRSKGSPRQGRAPGGAPGRNRTKGTKATERVRARGSHVRTGSLTQSAWGGGAEHSKNPDAASPAIGVDAWQWETGAAPPGSAASRTVTRATSAPAASSSACNSSKPTTTSTTPSTPPTGLSTATTLTATSCL